MDNQRLQKSQQQPDQGDCVSAVGPESVCGALQANGSPCMETETLAIVDKLNKVYRDRIVHIDRTVGDNIELKYPVYCEWVSTLIAQNGDLIEVVDELEREACHRLRILEAKLQNTNDYGRLNRLESDIASLLEVVRRAREDRKWDAKGLEFHEITYAQIFGSFDQSKTQQRNPDEAGDHVMHVNVEVVPTNIANIQLLQKEEEIKRLSNEVQYLKEIVHQYELETNRSKMHQQICETVVDACDTDSNDSNVIADNSEFDRIMNDLKETIRNKQIQLDISEDNNRLLSNKMQELETQISRKDLELHSFKKASIDARALVLEVAEKHDAILRYRNEITVLEDQLKRKDVHIHFKDEIIRDLRRECKKSNKAQFAEPSPREFKNATEIDSMVMQEKGTQIPTSYQCTEAINRNFNTDTTFYEKVPTVSTNQCDTNLIQQLAQKDDIIRDLHKELNELKIKRAASDTVILKHFVDVLKRCIQMESPNNSTSKTSSAASQYTSGIFSDAMSTVQEELTISSHKLSNDHNNEINNDLVVIQTIEDVLLELRDRLLKLKEENIELKETLVQLSDYARGHSKIRENLTSFSNEDYDDMQLKSEKRDNLIDVAKDFSHILGKQLSDESLAAVSNGDRTPFANLMNQLQTEIASKDRLLTDKEELILELTANLKKYKQDLYDAKKRNTVLGDERDRSNDSIKGLSEALDVHVQTINQLKTSKSKLEEDYADLQKMISSQNNNDKATADKCRKLENECKHQLMTISNLRSALEEASKRSAVSVAGSSTTVSSTSMTTPTTPSSSSSTSSINSNTHTTSMWSWWRTVHDV